MYIPKIGDKIDYQPKNTKYFIYAFIKSVEFIQESNLWSLEISYQITNDYFMKDRIIYPDLRVQKCGKILKGRDDCKI
jgi:hypothetical protein